MTLTSLPGGGRPLIPIPHFDLAAHMGFYFVLGLLLCRAAFRGAAPGSGRRAGLLAYALGQLYGIADELHQVFIPNRFCQISDVVADGVGVLLGIALYAWLLRRRASSRENLL